MSLSRSEPVHLSGHANYKAPKVIQLSCVWTIPLSLSYLASTLVTCVPKHFLNQLRNALDGMCNICPSECVPFLEWASSVCCSSVSMAIVHTTDMLIACASTGQMLGTLVSTARHLEVHACARHMLYICYQAGLLTS